jgi:hypothetical protein
MVTAMANLLGGRRDGSAAPSAGIGVCARRRAVGTNRADLVTRDANVSFLLCGSENDMRSLSGPPSGPARRDRGVAAAVGRQLGARAVRTNRTDPVTKDANVSFSLCGRQNDIQACFVPVDGLRGTDRAGSDSL